MDGADGTDGTALAVGLLLTVVYDKAVISTHLPYHSGDTDRLVLTQFDFALCIFYAIGLRNGEAENNTIGL